MFPLPCNAGFSPQCVSTWQNSIQLPLLSLVHSTPPVQRRFLTTVRCDMAKFSTVNAPFSRKCFLSRATPVSHRSAFRHGKILYNYRSFLSYIPPRPCNAGFSPQCVATWQNSLQLMLLSPVNVSSPVQRRFLTAVRFDMAKFYTITAPFSRTFHPARATPVSHHSALRHGKILYS